MGQGCFPDTRNVFDQQVPSRQQAAEGQANLFFFADHDIRGPLQYFLQ
jgi:hypothetical protein